MGVAYSVGEVDHLYTFFVQWSPDIYTARCRKRRSLLVVNKEKLAVIDSWLREPNPENWNIKWKRLETSPLHSVKVELTPN